MRRRSIQSTTVLFIIIAFAVVILIIKNTTPIPSPDITKVTATPAISAAPMATAVPVTSTPAPTEAGTTTYQLIVPSGYRETGTVPVYSTVACDFTTSVQPEWFNKSGIAESLSETSFVFTDHATLQYSADCLDYIQYSDEMYDFVRILQ